jgi:predicted amidophosphoribosyltransferase/GNAT superfamily N-acetyltransferase
MTINPQLLKIQPGDDRENLDGISGKTMLSFDLETPETAPDEWKAAAARRISETVGVPDPDGRVWKRDGKSFTTGTEYLDFMRGMLKSGNIWEYAATPELKTFEAADQAGKTSIARKAKGFLETSADSIAKAVTPQGYGVADNDKRLAGAPQEVIDANRRMREEKEAEERFARASLASTITLDKSIKQNAQPYTPRSEAERKADKDAIDAWRAQQEDASMIASHREKLMKENAWAVWLAVAPSLSEKGYKVASGVFQERKLSGADIADFQRLDEKEQAIIAKLARTVRNPIEGGLWNTLGDAGIGFVNQLLSLPVNAAKQIGTLGESVDRIIFGKTSPLLMDTEEANRRARTEQRLMEALDDPAGINPSGAEHGYLARSLIGAVSTLPYMGYASLGPAGVTAVGLDFMQQLDDRIAAEGGDVYGKDPKWLAQKALYGALYAGIEKLSAIPIFKETSDIALKVMFLKLATRHGAAAAEKIAAYIGKETFIESLEESAQKIIEEHALSVGLDKGPGWREAVRSGIGEFGESLGTMGIIATVGAGRQGFAARRPSQKNSLFDTALSSLRRESFLLTENPYSGKAAGEASDIGTIEIAATIDGYRTAWADGGSAELSKRYKLTEDQAAILDNVFSSENELDEVARFIDGRNIFMRTASHGAAHEDATAESIRKIVAEAGEEAPAKLVEMGFTEEGARRVADFFNAAPEIRKQTEDIVSHLQKTKGEQWKAQEGDRVGEAQDIAADLQPLRALYQRSGTRDNAAKAFKEIGLAEDQAVALASAFDEERKLATSPGAAAAFRAFYLDTSEEETAAQRLKRMTGFDADPAPEHGKGAARLSVKDGSGAIKGSVLFIPDKREQFDPESDHAGEAIEEATKGMVTAAEWKALTPEQRKESAARLGVKVSGGFTITSETDPSVQADGVQAKLLTGQMTLAPDAPSATLYHEATHAWLAVMRHAGKLTEADVKKLQNRYGVAENDPNWFNEEKLADDIREIGAARDFTPDQSLAARFIKAVWKVAGAARAQQEQARASSDAIQALYENIVYGKAFDGVSDLTARQAPPKAKESPSPVAGAATAKQEKSGTAQPDPQPEAKPEQQQAAPKKAQKKADPTSWTAATPQGNLRVGGYWIIAPRGRFISDTDPRYDSTLQGRARDVTLSSAEQVNSIAAEGTFDGLRLLDAPDTANGAPVAVPVTLKNPETGKDETYFMVISGNGRFRALDKIDDDNRGDEYRNPIRMFADEKGIPYKQEEMTPEARPRLVRILTRKPVGATLQQIAGLSNQNAVLQMTDAEQASSDAEMIERDGTAGLFSANKDGLPSKTGSDAFFAWFARAAGDASLIDSKGNPTAVARDRARRAMLAVAIGKGKNGRETVMVFTEAADALGLERQRDALLMSAGFLSALEASKPGYGLSDDLSRATAAMLTIARDRKSGKTSNAETFISQGDLINPIPSEVAQLIRILDSSRPAEGVAEVFRRYADLASRIDTETPDMFGEPPTPKHELLKKATTDTEVETGTRYSLAVSKAPDAAYMKAAKRRDLDTAQKMVIQVIAENNIPAIRQIGDRLFFNGDDVGMLETQRGPGGEVEISRLYIDADRQGEGIGSAVIPYLFAQGAKRITAYPLESSWWLRQSPDAVLDDGTMVYTTPKNPRGILSADPITYDAQGNMVPISKRFNAYSSGSMRYSIALAARRYALATDMPKEGEQLIVKQLEFLFAQRMDPEYKLKTDRAAAKRKATLKEKERARIAEIGAISGDALEAHQYPELWRKAFRAAGNTVSRVIHEFFMQEGPQVFPLTYQGKPIEGMKIEKPVDVAALLMPLRNPYQESTKAIFLDDRNRIINAQVVTVGLLDSTSYHPREFFKKGIKAGAKGIIIAHNHPSGDPTPSDQDRNVTRRNIEAGKVLGIDHIDHIITNGNKFHSIREGMTHTISADKAEWEATRAGATAHIGRPEELARFAHVLKQSGDMNYIHAIMLDSKAHVQAVHRIPYTDTTFHGDIVRSVYKAAAGEPTAMILLDLTADNMTPKAAKDIHSRMLFPGQNMGMPVEDSVYIENGMLVSAKLGAAFAPQFATSAPQMEVSESEIRYSIEAAEAEEAKKVADQLFDVSLARDPGAVRLVPVEALQSDKGNPEKSITNAEGFMRAAMAGTMARREPINVALYGDGTMYVIDGNATTSAAKRMGIKAVWVQAKPALRGGSTANSALFIDNRNAYYKQSFASLDDLYAAAGEVMGGFYDTVKAIAQKAGIGFKTRTGLKKRERVEKKTSEEYNGDFNQVVDVAGATLILEEGQRFDDAIKAVKKSGLEIVRLKNGYTAESMGGYRDIKLNIKLSNGVVGEIIVIEAEILRLKDEHGHHIYKMIRDAGNRKLKTGDEKLKTALASLIDIMERVSAVYYGMSDETYEALEAALSASSLSRYAQALDSSSTNLLSVKFPAKNNLPGVLTRFPSTIFNFKQGAPSSRLSRASETTSVSSLIKNIELLLSLNNNLSLAPTGPNDNRKKRGTSEPRHGAKVERYAEAYRMLLESDADYNLVPSSFGLTQEEAVAIEIQVETEDAHLDDDEPDHEGYDVEGGGHDMVETPSIQELLTSGYQKLLNFEAGKVDIPGTTREDIILEMEYNIREFGTENPADTLGDITEAQVIEIAKDAWEYRQALNKRRASKALTNPRYSVSAEQDAAYLAAVQRGDTDTAAKMVEAAAEAAGYQFKKYHQTSGLARQAIYREGFRLDKGRARLSDEQVPDAFFFKQDPADIKIGSVDDAVQIPVYLKWWKPKLFSNRAEVEKWANEDPRYVEIKARIKKWDNENDEEFDRRWKQLVEFDRSPDAKAAKDALRADLALDEHIKAWEAGTRAMAAEARANITQRLLDEGYDAISIFRDEGSFKRVVWTTCVFTPEQIKSADPVTYDDAGQVIPLSKRFDPLSTNIRYRLETEQATNGLAWMRDYYDESHGDQQAGSARDKREQLAAEFAAVEAAHTNPNGTRKATWMTAPNGAPSELNARNWVLVRTPAFKKWFGDWEKFANGKDGNGVFADDKGEVSKAVDKNGEPLVVYHGTERFGFTIMDPEKADTHRSPMIFASSELGTARSYTGGATIRDVQDLDKAALDEVAREFYGDEESFDTLPADKRNVVEKYYRAEFVEPQSGVYPLFLNIRNPQETDFEGANWDGDREGWFEIFDEDGEKYYDRETGKGFFSDDDAEEITAELSIQTGKSYEWQEATTHHETTNTVSEDALRFGHDGVIIRNVVDDGGRGGSADISDVFVIFKSNQAKSATQNIGAFDPADNDIRYSVQTRKLEPMALPDSMAEVYSGTNIASLAQTKFKEERARHKAFVKAQEWDKAEAYARGLAEKESTALLGHYLLAKYHGDMESARIVVEKWAKPEEAYKIKLLVNRAEIFRPVLAAPLGIREGNRFNALPIEYAAWLAKQIGGDVSNPLLMSGGTPNTGATNAARSANPHTFYGGEEIDNVSPVILVDDVWTRGGTLWTAYEHIKEVNSQVNVIAFATMAVSRYGKNIRPTQNQLTSFWKKSKLTTISFKKRIGNDIEKLTGSEIHAYLITGRAGPDGAQEFFDDGQGGTGSDDQDSRQSLWGEGPEQIRYALDVSGQAYSKEDLLTGFMAHAAMTGATFPNKKTVARIAENIGVETFDYKKLSDKARELAKTTEDKAIKKAAVSGSRDKTAYAIGELARKSARAYVRSGAREGERLAKSADRIRGLTEENVRKTIQLMTAADYADLKTDTGIDIAASILAADPQKFQPQDPEEPTAAGSGEADAKGTWEDPSNPETDENAPDLSDKQRAEIRRKRKEREERVQAFLEAATKRGARNSRKEEEQKKRAADKQLAQAANGNEGAGGDGASGGKAPKRQQQEEDTPGDPINFADRWAAAALLRVWAFDRFTKENPNRRQDPANDRVAIEFYRKTAERQLSDLARKLLEPGYKREVVLSWISNLSPGLSANQVERRTAYIFGLLNRYAVREERKSLVKKFRAEIKRQFIKGERFEELDVDLGRALTGAIEEDARYVMRICELSEHHLEGDTSALQRERDRLEAIIHERAGLHDMDGNPLSETGDDMPLRKAYRQMALLERYGGMVDMLPGEILDLSGKALDAFAQEAVALRERWQAYDDLVKSIRDPLAAAIARNPDDPKAEATAAGALADSLTGMLRLRLDFLTRYAEPSKREAGRAAIADIMDLLARGNTDYAIARQEDEAALNRALGEIFRSPDGKPDRKRIRAYLRRMDERIPYELSAQISLQGHQGAMTYGQMLQLLVSLEQTASYSQNIEKHGRQEQADLIRSHVHATADGATQRTFTNEDAQLVEWLRRSFYTDKRGVISVVTDRIAGRGIDSPDPFYHPVKMLLQKTRAMHVGENAWQPLAGVFSRRVKNTLDFDETASILDVFEDRSRETALLMAFSERGLVLREVLINQSLQDAIRRFHGEATLATILRQIEQTLNGGKPRAQSDAQTAAAALAMRVTTYIGLGWNIQSAAKQAASLPAFANKIGFKKLLAIMASPVDKDAVSRLRNSEEYRVRYGTGPSSGMDIATKGAYEDPGDSAFKKFFGDWGLWANRKTDWIISAWIGQAVYRDLKASMIDKGMSEEEADRRAISETFSMIEETQQSGRTENTMALTREHGILGKMLTQFATSPLQQMQYEMAALREWRDLVAHKGPEANIKEARDHFMRAAFINHVLIPAAMTAITSLYKATTGDEPDWKKEGFWWTLLISAIMGQFSRILFLGAFTEQTLRALFLRQRPNLGQLVPAEGVIRFSASLAYPVRDIATWDTEHLRADILRLLKSTAVTRLPAKLYESLDEEAAGAR